MILFPNAKLNLGLSVVSKREDGYHNLETIFYPIPLYDALEVLPTNQKTHLIEQGIVAESIAERNIVIKAYRLLAEQFNLPELAVRLHKTIPMGAGMGGGSADGAFMIRLLNEYAGLQLSQEEMAHYANQLGADCPFFIYNQPLYAEGTGNLFTPVSLSLAGYTLILVKPEIHISTQIAFSGITPKRPQLSVKEAIQQPVERWKESLFNDFEKSIFPRFPQLESIKETLYEHGADYACMTGSGSTIFALFKEEPNSLESLFTDCFYYQCKLLSSNRQ